MYMANTEVLSKRLDEKTKEVMIRLRNTDMSKKDFDAVIGNLKENHKHFLP